MAGMKITLSSAMRARDVSRPQPHHEAAAQAADATEPAGPVGSRSAAGTGQRGPTAGSAARTSPAHPGPAPGTAGPGGPAPAGDPVAGPGVRPEGSAAEPATGGQRSEGSRRHRSRRRGR
jgi:hypothetical protein